MDLPLLTKCLLQRLLTLSDIYPLSSPSLLSLKIVSWLRKMTTFNSITIKATLHLLPNMIRRGFCCSFFFCFGFRVLHVYFEGRRIPVCIRFFVEFLEGGKSHWMWSSLIQQAQESSCLCLPSNRIADRQCACAGDPDSSPHSCVVGTELSSH